MSDPQWIYPPPFGKVGDYSDLPNFVIGQTYQVNWTALPSGAETNLWLMQDEDGLFCPEFNLAATSCVQYLRLQVGSAWQWTVTTPENYTSSYPFYWFQMTHDDNSGWFSSHYFNILPQGALPPTTTPASSSTSSASPSATGSGVLSQSSASSGLSSGTKIAIGVSVGVGVPLLIILALIAFFLMKNARKRGAQNDNSQPPPFYSDEPSKQSDKQVAQWGSPQQTVQSWSAAPQEMGHAARSPQEIGYSARSPQDMINSTRSPQELAAAESDRLWANRSEMSGSSPHS